LNDIRRRCLVLFSLSLISLSFVEAALMKPRILHTSKIVNTSECREDRLERSLESLRASTPEGLSNVNVALCKENGRCDGGFVWLPLTFNRSRALVVYALDQKSLSELLEGWTGIQGLLSTRSDEITVSIRNICSQNNMVTGTFLNLQNTAYLQANSAWVKATTFDATQAAFKGFDDIYLRLYPNGEESRLGIYGMNKSLRKPVQIDDFAVLPL